MIEETIPDVLRDEDTQAVIEHASWCEATLFLDLKVLDGNRWRITCTDVSDWRLDTRFLEGIGVAAEDHPLLWMVRFARRTAYFVGRPANPSSAACDVLSRLPFSNRFLMLSPKAMAELLASGNGCLGDLPIPAFELCAAILAEHEVQVYSAGPDRDETAATHTAILLGNDSYVVAAKFRADMLPSDQ